MENLNQTTQYQGNFQILVEPVNAENASLAAPASSENSSQRSAALDYPTQIAILKSPELLGAVLEELQPTYPNLNYGSLASQINIERLGQTKMLQVGYQSSQATQTQTVLSALAKEYLQYSLSERQTYLRQGLQFVDEQLSALNSRLNELQNRLEGFQRQNKFVDPETRSAQLVESIAALTQKQQELEQNLVTLQAQEQVLQQEKGMQVMLESDSAYQQLLSQMQAIDTQIATELTRFRPDNPAIQTLEKQRENLLPLLEQQAQQFLDTRLAEVTIQRQAIETQLQSIRKARAEAENQVQILPTLNREYGNIQKELEITNASLTSFLETQQSLQVEAAQQEIPWELVKEPTTAPIASDVVKSLITALLMGIALGGAVAFALDKLDNTYHTPEELKGAVKLPVLGVLPFNQQLFLNEGIALPGKRRKRKLLSRLRATLIKASAKVSKSMSSMALSLLDEYDSSAEFVEALRVLHVNLQMSNVSKPARIVTISSATPGDGKSTIALNWAQTAVSMGQRVLLIDGVLRSPQLHHILELPNQNGLSNLLSQDLKPADGIQQVYPDGKLYAITAGQPVENPASLLSSPKMEKFLTYYKKFFDLVIIDTPSVSGLADATIINRHTDGLILVVRLDQTNKTSFQQTLESLQTLHTSLLGIIINGYKGHNAALREAALDSDLAAEAPSAISTETTETSSAIPLLTSTEDYH
ncbi:MAG: polysaccharide biosynthesis tyrosine autokinase [Phormidesmis sp.]